MDFVCVRLSKWECFSIRSHPDDDEDERDGPIVV